MPDAVENFKITFREYVVMSSIFINRKGIIFDGLPLIFTPGGASGNNQATSESGVYATFRSKQSDPSCDYDLEILFNPDPVGGDPDRVIVQANLHNGLYQQVAGEGTVSHNVDGDVHIVYDGESLKYDIVDGIWYGSLTVGVLGDYSYWMTPTNDPSRPLVIVENENNTFVKEVWGVVVDYQPGDEIKELLGNVVVNAVPNGQGIFFGDSVVSNVLRISGTGIVLGSDTQLSETRQFTASAGVGNLALFYGGQLSDNSKCAKLTSVNAAGTVVREIASVGNPRSNAAGGNIGSKGLFYGGFNVSTTNQLLIINAFGAAESSTQSLSTPRYNLAAASLEDGVQFYGGIPTSGGSDVMLRITLPGGVVTSTENTLATSAFGRAGAGLSTAAMYYGGYSGGSPYGTVHLMNAAGTLITGSSVIGSGRRNLGGANVTGNGLFYGGYMSFPSERITRITPQLTLVSADVVAGISMTGVSGASVATGDVIRQVVMNGQVIWDLSAAMFYGGHYGVNGISRHLTRINSTGNQIGIETEPGIGQKANAGVGISGLGLFYGGYNDSDSVNNIVERFSQEGVALSTGTNATTSRQGHAGANPGNVAMFFAGFNSNGDYTNHLLRFNSSGLLLTGGSGIGLARARLAGVGLGNYALFYGGTAGALQNTTTVFAEGGSLRVQETNVGRDRHSLAGVGFSTIDVGLFHAGWGNGFYLNTITKIDSYGNQSGQESTVGATRMDLAAARAGSNGIFYGGQASSGVLRYTLCLNSAGTQVGNATLVGFNRSQLAGAGV